MKNFFAGAFFCALGALYGAETLVIPLEPEDWTLKGTVEGVTLARTENEIEGKTVPVLEITIDPKIRAGAELTYKFREGTDAARYVKAVFMVASSIAIRENMVLFSFTEGSLNSNAANPLTKSLKIFWNAPAVSPCVEVPPGRFQEACAWLRMDRSNPEGCPAKSIQFQFSFNARGAAAGEKVKFRIASLRLEGERDEFTELSDAWDRRVRGYKADYSDSTKYLEPPAEGRMKEPFAVVKAGKAAAEIVYAEQESETVRIAAEELRDTIEKITGVKLPVFCSSAALDRETGRNKIVLGKQLYADSEVLKKLSGTDGFAIRRDGGRLYVYGICGKGVMNGVYTLLENNTDIIWARPHKEFGTVYTKRKDLNFIWGEDIVDRPASRVRGWNGYVDLVWMSRNRCNLFNGGGGGDIAWMNKKKAQYGVFETCHLFGHNIGHFVHEKQYFKTHPEYYSLIEMTDKKTGKSSLLRRPWHQFCFTNPEMKKVFIENALAIVRSGPEDIAVLNIHMDDVFDMCLCENCRKPIVLKDGRVVEPGSIAFRSTQYFLFLNDVVAALNREFPGLRVKTIAYFWTQIPPECEVHPHIIPEFAFYPRPNDKTPMYHPENRFALNNLVGWAKKSPAVDVYGYHGLGLVFPRPLAEVCAEDLKMFHRYTRGVSSEYKHAGDADAKDGASVSWWDYSALEFWVMTRLYWDPEQDVEQLRKYFIRRTFREAAPAMEKFYGIIREAWMRDPSPRGLGFGPVPCTKVYILDAGHEAELRRALEEAEKSVKHPVSRKLVKRVRTCFERYVSEAKKQSGMRDERAAEEQNKAIDSAVGDITEAMEL